MNVGSHLQFLWFHEYPLHGYSVEGKTVWTKSVLQLYTCNTLVSISVESDGMKMVSVLQGKPLFYEEKDFKNE